MLRITPATTDDIPTIRALAHATWPDTFGTILSPEQIAYMLDWMYSPETLRIQMDHGGHRFLLATIDEEGGHTTPVGYASYELMYHGEPTTKLHKLYVHPSRQGYGVGHALMEAVRIAAESAGQRSLTLNVNRHNHAIQFYERHDFVAVGSEDIDIGRGFYMNDIIMARPLRGTMDAPDVPTPSAIV